MSERRLVPRRDMIFTPWVKYSEGNSVGTVLDLNQVGLLVLSDEEIKEGDQFHLFVGDDHHEELVGQEVELSVEVMRCKKYDDGTFEIGFTIVEVISEDGQVYLNKLVRLLGSYE
ncbi:MAG: hypothetical protein COA79_01560 [Planctomycetota bacterium]|nr:MAG: hypothetical protein COA79_01560 [Planctomycetota bacterium]